MCVYIKDIHVGCVYAYIGMCISYSSWFCLRNPDWCRNLDPSPHHPRAGGCWPWASLAAGRRQFGDSQLPLGRGVGPTRSAGGLCTHRALTLSRTSKSPREIDGWEEKTGVKGLRSCRFSKKTGDSPNSPIFYCHGRFTMCKGEQQVGKVPKSHSSAICGMLRIVLASLAG